MAPRKSSTSVKPKMTSETCGTCKKDVTDNDSALMCELCKQWHHSNCLSIPDQVMDFFNSDAYSGSGISLPLVCPACKPSFSRLTELNTKFAAMEENFERRLAALEAPKAVLVAPRLVGPPPPPVNFTTLIKSTLEAETKKHNAVLFGLPEETDDLAAVRKLVSAGNENEENLIVKPSDIIRVFRDGPVYKDAPRFLKVVCVTSKVQQSFIGLINKVVKQDKPDLRARPDLTWEQRDAGRKLREQWKARGESKDQYIDYARRVIIDKKSHETVFALAMNTA